MTDDSPTHKTIRWGNNFLEFNRDPHNHKIWQCNHFRVNAELLEETPKKIFEILIKRGWVKPSEVKF